MIRYVTRRPRAIEAGDDWWPEERRSIDVIMTEAATHDTGLVDASGLRLYRVPSRNPIGFVPAEGD